MECELTEYERQRLENIKRNDQMLASLKIHSCLSDLSKRTREEKKSYKHNTSTVVRKSKSETPIVIRQSRRARGMPPDSSGLPPHFSDLFVPKAETSSHTHAHTHTHTCPSTPGPLSMRDTFQGYPSQLHQLSTLLRGLPTPNPHLLVDDAAGVRNANRTSLRLRSSSHSQPSFKMKRLHLDNPIDPSSFQLQPQNIARLLPGKILSVKFLPTANMTMVVAGNKYGDVAFWDVMSQNEDGNGIYLYHPHSAPVSALSFHPFTPYKMYSSGYDGILRVMDPEKEVFDLVYSSSSGSALFSLSQHPHNANSVYLGEGQGDLNMLDARVGKISSSWSLHEGRINSVDFCSANTDILATSSTDGLACLWDLRKMDLKHPKSKSLQTVNHGRAVQSAYFSPSGRCLATTSLDDNIGVLGGANFEDKFMIKHNNWTNRWISSFRGIWGWDDTHVYVGNMKRMVDVVSVIQRKTVYAVQSPLISAIPCRYDAHPCTVGMLAGATSGGQIYIWTTSS